MRGVLFILLLLLPVLGIAQVQKEQQKDYNYEYTDTYETEIYYDWKVSDESVIYYGEPCFYWAVSRSVKKFDGYYIYDVWLLSNSYNYDYDTEEAIWKYTFVDGMFIICNGAKTSDTKCWASFKDMYSEPCLRFYSVSKNPTIKLYWNKTIIP